MTALGQKAISTRRRGMSVLPPGADMPVSGSFAPIAATCRTATKKALKRWHALRLGTFLCHESQSRRL
jgi:hypothetical protein